ncbi:MAG: Na+:solute symporter [Planctomycetota bacterium]|nr:Na+:solute symporter [Planctomycetota bacterium]
MGRFEALDWIAIIGYIVFAMSVGIYLTKRASKSTDDFYLAGRSLKWWVAGTSLVATSFAADTPLVISGWVRSSGISQNWLWWGMAVGGSLTFVVLAAWWRRLEVTTDAEFIERRYSGKPASFLRGFYGCYHALITNTIVLTWVLLAMLKLVRVILGAEDGSYDIYIVGGGLVLALSYSFLSGLWGVVVTDLMQFTLAMFGAIFLAYKSIDALGGFTAAQQAFAELPRATTSIMPLANEEGLSWDSIAWWSQGFGAFFIFIGVQGWLNKNADGGGAGVQRYSASLDENHARKAALWFNIAHYCIRPWPWIIVGLASIILIDPSALPVVNGAIDHEAAYPMMMAQLLGPGLFGLLCASFLAAFMSTLDTHFNLASAYLVNDVYRRFVRKEAPDKHYVWVGRFAEILIGIIAATFALQADSIANLFTFSLSLMGGLGPALLLRWFWRRANVFTEISALATSTILTFVTKSLEFDYPFSYMVVVLGSLVVAVSVTYVTPPADEDTLDRFYSIIRPDEISKPHFFAAWGGGIALIYGLLLAIGQFLLGGAFIAPLVISVNGAIILRLCWHKCIDA